MKHKISTLILVAAVSLQAVIPIAYAGLPPIRSTGQTYITTQSPSTVVANPVNLATSHVTGILPLASGGFGLANTQTDLTTTGTITALSPATSFLNFTSNAANKTIQGMVSNGTNQRVVIRHTGTGTILTVVNESSGATAANRFALEAGKDLILVPGAETEFLYNTTSSRWNVKEIRNQVANDGINNLFSLISGTLTNSNNVVLGNQAVGANTYAGGSSVIIGYQAAQNASGGLNNNVVIGPQAGKSLLNTTGAEGQNNTLLGVNAGTALTKGQANTMIGSAAGSGTTTGQQNVYVGPAGSNNTTGNYNVAIGLSAGFRHQTGDYNISIGQASGSTSATNLSNTITIGQQAQVTSSNQGSIGAVGAPINLGINKSNPQYVLDVAGDVNTSGSFRINGVAFTPTGFWNTAGNSLSGGEFFGSTNFTPVPFYTNNSQAGLISGVGLWGFAQTTPTAVVHAGVKTGTVGVPGALSAAISALNTSSGYSFGSGDKDYSLYASESVSGVDIYSSSGANVTFTEPSTAGYDVTGATASPQSGSGYDGDIDTPPTYQVWAIYASGAIQSVTPSATGGFSWPGSGFWDVSISWTAPSGPEAPSSYFIARNGADSQTTGSTSLVDNNSGWSGAASPGLPDVNSAFYTVGLSGSSVSGATSYRLLNTTSGTFIDNASPGDTDDGTWASGSTVTPTSSDYESLHVDGDATVDGKFHIASQAPATSSDACTTGQIAWDSGFIYVCVATNTWMRSVLLTF